MAIRDVQSVHNRTTALESTVSVLQAKLEQFELRVPYTTSPPPLALLLAYSSDGVQTYEIELDTVDALTLLCLDIELKNVRRMSTSERESRRRDSKGSVNLLRAVAGFQDRLFQLDQFTNLTSRSMSNVPNNNTSTFVPSNFTPPLSGDPSPHFYTPRITPLLFKQLPNSRDQTSCLLPAFESLLILHPINHLPTLMSRVKVIAAGEFNNTMERGMTMAFFSLICIALALGALAHRAKVRAEGTGGSGGVEDVSIGDVVRLWAMSVKALQKAQMLEEVQPPLPNQQPSPPLSSKASTTPTRVQPAATTSTSRPTSTTLAKQQDQERYTPQTDRLVASLLHLIFLLHLPELDIGKDGSGPVLEGWLNENVVDMVQRTLADVKSLAGRLGVFRDPDSVPANPTTMIGVGSVGDVPWMKEERRRWCAAIHFYDWFVFLLLPLSLPRSS